MLPSPSDRRVGIRIRASEACSGFNHVTAHRIAQPPKAAFVTRLQPCRLPDRTARQLPDQSTTLWVESSSTSDPRLRGARSTASFWTSTDHFRSTPTSGHFQCRSPCLKGAMNRHGLHDFLDADCSALDDTANRGWPYSLIHRSVR